MKGLGRGIPVVATLGLAFAGGAAGCGDDGDNNSGGGGGNTAPTIGNVLVALNASNEAFCEKLFDCGNAADYSDYFSDEAGCNEYLEVDASDIEGTYSEACLRGFINYFNCQTDGYACENGYVESADCVAEYTFLEDNDCYPEQEET